MAEHSLLHLWQTLGFLFMVISRSQSGPNAIPAASVNENLNLLAAFNKLYQAGSRSS